MKHSLLILLVISVSRLSSQEPAWKNVSIKDGLPSSEVYHVFQDKKGFIWFATDAGVCLYDGEKVNTLTSKDGLYENVILGIYEDNKGRIWFRGFSGSLSFYKNGVITCINGNETLYNMLKPNGIITSLFLGGGDTLFCGTNQPIGIVKIAPKNNYEKVYTDKSLLENSRAFVLQNKMNQDIIYGESNLVPANHSLFVKLANRQPYLQTFPAGIVRSHFKYALSPTGKIYATSMNNLTMLSIDSIISKRLPSTINYILVDKNNDLWIGLYKQGLLLYKNSDLSSVPLHFLKNSSVSSILCDRENSLWVTTLDKGVMVSLNTKILKCGGEDMRVGCFFRDDSILYIGLNSQPKILLMTATRGIIGEKPIMIHESEDLLGITRLGNDWFYATSFGGIVSKAKGNFSKFQYHFMPKQSFA
jgi:hypothetical protein